MSELTLLYAQIAEAAEGIFRINGARDSVAEDIYDIVLGVLGRMESCGACRVGSADDDHWNLARLIHREPGMGLADVA